MNMFSNLNKSKEIQAVCDKLEALDLICPTCCEMLKHTAYHATVTHPHIRIEHFDRDETASICLHASCIIEILAYLDLDKYGGG